jgi:hypothetical protein
MSENIVVESWSYPEKCLNVFNPPEFAVGVGSETPLPSRDGSALLMTATMRVTDKQPAYLHVNRDGSAPLCVTESWPEPHALGWAGSMAGEKPVAGVNALDMLTPEQATALGFRQLSLSIKPNPFNPMTAVSFELPQRSLVQLAVYDIKGRRVAVLADGYCESGQYEEHWNGRDDAGQPVSSGIYFLRLECDQGALIEKMMVVR